tara:strand:+ start:12454 stop:12594 length:141 start_codon:yes stop_codon:yes gene_type:complete
MNYPIPLIGALLCLVGGALYMNTSELIGGLFVFFGAIALGSVEVDR